MKYLSALALAILLFALPAFAQQTWQRTYGGTNVDGGSSVQQTTDGGYIVSGYTSSYGAGYSDVYLVKTNASGDTLWTRTYGGWFEDQGWSVQQTFDGGYIAAGYAASFGNGYQVYLVKTNASGDTLWTRTYGGALTERGFAVQQTRDSGYVVAGHTNSFGNAFQAYLVKTDASGDTLWTRTYGGTGNDGSEAVCQTSDGGYLLTGATASFGSGYQVFLVKTNASGDTLWTRAFGETGDEWGESVLQTTDSGFVIAGHTTSFGNSGQIFLIKTNPSGDTLWTKNFGGADDDYGESVQQTSDGGYFLTGVSGYLGADAQVFLVRTNASGDSLWTRTYGGTSAEYGESGRQTSDGGYIVTGYTGSYGNGDQVYLIKTDANGNVGTERGQEVEGPRVQGFKITPNPFISFASVPGHKAERFSLYDVSGRKVGTYKGDRIGEGLAPGVYFLRPESREARPLRIVKIR